ncbi:MAG TPA: DinB family protein [Candidatus Dormibacteraeota bacterium]|jgi:uncharacterized damage-inducible protein DinB
MIEPFRHNAWATLRLLEFCRDLDPAMLDASAPRTYGPINETLAHVVGTEEMLAAMVEGAAATGPPPGFTSVDDLLERARWMAERWERLLESAPHPERLVEVDRAGVRQLVRVGTVLAQVVHHGNHHRSLICSALTGIGLEPPRLDGWAYGAWLAERIDPRHRRPDIV